MSIPVTRGTHDVLTEARACIIAYSPSVLSAIGTEYSRTMRVFADVWVGEYEPVAHDSPGCGLWIASSVVAGLQGSNEYNVRHTLHARMVLNDASAGATSFSDFTLTMHMYAQAVQYTLSRYLVDTASAAAGIIACELISNTPEPLTEFEGGGMEQVVDIQLSVMQRVARWEA